MPPFAGTGITAHHLIHDAAMCAVVAEVMARAPGGVVRQGTKKQTSQPGPVVGQLAFTGGTALSMCHRVTERYSEDVDFVFIVDPAFRVTQSAKTAAQRLPLRAARAALDAETTDPGTTRLGQRLLVSRVDYGADHLLSVDVAWRDDFGDHPELLGVSNQQAVSLLARFADATHLPLAARGPHEVPCLGVPYVAATKLDALHLRAVQGDTAGLTSRARDLYDLAMIARSAHAHAVRETLPALAQIVEGDVRNQGRFPRPATGYAASPAFTPGSAGAAALRAGWERVQAMVYGQPIAFDEALNAARSLDPC